MSCMMSLIISDIYINSLPKNVGGHGPSSPPYSYPHVPLSSQSAMDLESGWGGSCSVCVNCKEWFHATCAMYIPIWKHGKSRTSNGFVQVVDR